ncbi:MAG: hypothetical protein A2Y25_11695 [Candidatus Melainabacteria bacterium GWF2_37_15]|nr:MAG: hypothetical protein A2Y25_11695 [Candidatus Melainabacteria bacterium GWF2_37_15]
MDNFIKEKVAYYKLWLTLLYTTDAGLIAWFFNNYDQIGSNIKIIIVEILIFFITLFLLSINHKARNFINRIGD